MTLEITTHRHPSREGERPRDDGVDLFFGQPDLLLGFPENQDRDVPGYTEDRTTGPGTSRNGLHEYLGYVPVLQLQSVLVHPSRLHEVPVQRVVQVPHLDREEHVLHHRVQHRRVFVESRDTHRLLDDPEPQTVHLPVRLPGEGHERLPEVVDLGPSLSLPLGALDPVGT